MGRAVSGCRSARGGKSRTQQFNSWKSSAWSFTVDGCEAKRQLMVKKRKVEAQLRDESAKRQHLETVVESLNREVEVLKDLTGISNHSRRKDWASYTRPQTCNKEAGKNTGTTCSITL